jgi:hypothetical protein
MPNFQFHTRHYLILLNISFSKVIRLLSAVKRHHTLEKNTACWLVRGFLSVIDTYTPPVCFHFEVDRAFLLVAFAWLPILACKRQ